jgi:hypothetical protein
MKDFNEIILKLPDMHRTALTWFLRNRGTEQTWPKPLSDGTLLASKVQGIYKPKWTKYCLSIRQNLRSRYADKELQVRSDGTWSFVYAQEASDPRSRDADYANRSLIACMEDRVPIGVIKQISETPVSRYQVLGVAMVFRHYEGYFLIEGFAADGTVRGLESPKDLNALVTIQQEEMIQAGVFDPDNIIDAREKALASIIRRRGQPNFRQQLLEIYGTRCAVTNCDVVEALEAVHILPYKGPQTDHSSNGLLLRADIHVLFDLGLIAVDTRTMTLLISPSLMGSSYAGLSGTTLRLPETDAFNPSREALDQHRAWTGL